MVDLRTNITDSDGNLAGILNEERLAINALGSVVQPVGSAIANRTLVESALAAAVAAGATLSIKGAFTVDGTIAAPSGSRIDATGASITQTASLTPIFTVASHNGFTLTGGTFIGKTTDYVDNPADSSGAMFAAAVVKATSSQNIRIRDVNAFGFGGPLLYATSCTGIWVESNTVIGVGNGGGHGSIVWSAGASKNNAGIIVDGPSTGVWITGNDFSYLAQGILGGTNYDVHINRNRIHDIGGQHAIYMNNTYGLEVVGNVMRNCAANGVKVQLSTLGTGDCTDIVVSGNVGSDLAGGLVALLVNGSWPSAGADRHRRVVITGNVGIRLGSGILVQVIDGFLIANNIIRTCVGAGIRVDDCVNGAVTDNITRDTSDEGVRVNGLVTVALVACDNIRVARNRVIDPGTSNTSTTEFGISTAGSGNLAFEGNWITDAAGNMRYGIYVASGTQSTMDFIENRVTGASDYGFRGAATSSCRTYRGNSFAGTLGDVTVPPTSGVGSTAGRLFGSGTPEAVATANPGALYFNTATTGHQLWTKISGTTATGWVPTIGVTVLGSTISINAKGVAANTIYTVPTGRTAIITGAVVRCVLATAITAGPTLGIGIAAGEDDIFTPIALTGLTSTTKVHVFSANADIPSAAAGTAVKVGVDTAASGTSQNIIVDLLGYLI